MSGQGQGQQNETLLGNQPRDPLEFHGRTSTYADTVRLEATGTMAKIIFGETVRNGAVVPVAVITMPMVVFAKLGANTNQIMSMLRAQGAINANDKPIIQQ